jgi:hypothetical protein
VVDRKKIVAVGRGKVGARIPTEPERQQHGISQGVPVLVVTRGGHEEEIYPADRVEIEFGQERCAGCVEREEREASSWQAAREEVKDPAFVGVPAVRVIAQRLGVSIEEAMAWWERMRAETAATRPGAPDAFAGDGEPCGE